MQQIGGIQLSSKPGTDFNTQYSVSDTGLTNNTTLAKSTPLYNLLQVMFQGKQTDKLGEFANSDVFQQNGLRPNIDKGDHKLFTQAWLLI